MFSVEDVPSVQSLQHLIRFIKKKHLIAHLVCYAFKLFSLFSLKNFKLVSYIRLNWIIDP
jgi:hypothetical protein